MAAACVCVWESMQRRKMISAAGAKPRRRNKRSQQNRGKRNNRTLKAETSYRHCLQKKTDAKNKVTWFFESQPIRKHGRTITKPGLVPTSTQSIHMFTGSKSCTSLALFSVTSDRRIILHEPCVTSFPQERGRAERERTPHF